jgi:hypothetical protein
MSDDDVTPAAPVPDFYAARAAERAFPTRLPAPGVGGGMELGASVQLYSTDAAPFPTPADVPASAPPVVASGPGNRVGWLLRGRRGKGGDGTAA